jgi:hypothetical protein
MPIETMWPMKRMVKMNMQFLYLVLIIVALVPLSIVKVWGTNESSYRYGVHLAINNLTNQIVPPWDVDEDNPSPSWYVKWPSHFFMNPDICNLDSADNGCPSIGDVQAVYCTTGQSDHSAVTNSTACIDGYVDGWKYFCTKDNYNNSKYCSDFVFGGNTKDGSDFDGTLLDEGISNQTAHFWSIKHYVDSWRYFCTKDGYKNAKICDYLVFVKGDFPGTFMNQNKTLLSIMRLQSLLSGSTWNFVNESNGHGISKEGPNIITSAAQEKAAMKIFNQDMKTFDRATLWNSPVFIMSNITKFSGKITFYNYQIRINTTNGIDPTYTSDPSWDIEDGGKTLVLDGITPPISDYFYFQKLTFLKISPHLIELQDKHKDIIQLTR